MPAARCSMCAANYPSELEGHSCPNCGERLYLQRDEEPDPELLHYAPAQAQPALPSSSEAEEEIEEEGEVSTARVIERDGLLWVATDVLNELGYYDLDTFTRIEVDGLVYEVQGFKASSGEWWVEAL